MLDLVYKRPESRSLSILLSNVFYFSAIASNFAFDVLRVLSVSVCCSSSQVMSLLKIVLPSLSLSHPSSALLVPYSSSVIFLVRRDMSMSAYVSVLAVSAVVIDMDSVHVVHNIRVKKKN